MAESTESLKGKLRGKKPPSTTPRKQIGLSTGSTLLNLAMTSSPHVGIYGGSYYLLVGDSRSGKTWCALNVLAEASVSPDFQDHRLIYDAPERGARMDMARYFGKKMADKLEWKYSKTIQDFYFALDDCIKDGRPFIYVEDSESALTSEGEQEKFKEQKKAHEKGKETTGSYGDGKAKIHSSNLRVATNDLEKSNSVLLMIAQSRDNIGFGAQFNPKTRGGGRALTFYATGEMWFTVREGIKRKVKGRAERPHKIGNILQVQVKKNRDTGREPIVELHHYFSAGLDDVGSCIQYLLDEKHWAGTEDKFEAPEFGFTGSREKLVLQVEDEGREKEIRRMVTEVWQEIEEACSVVRKPRYS